jgi:hypothetical protein
MIVDYPSFDAFLRSRLFIDRDELDGAYAITPDLREEIKTRD